MKKNISEITRGYDKYETPRDIQPGANKTKDRPPNIDKSFVLPPPKPTIKPKKD